MEKKTKDEIESVIIEKTTAELEVDMQNHRRDNEDFELYQSMYDLVPEMPEEEWMSNVSLPEFLTEITVQAGLEAAQEFKRRDFVEIYHESKDEEHRLSGEAKKELINRTLNQRHLHYFQKRMRASGLKNMSGKVYFKCMWERKSFTSTITEEKAIPLENPLPGGQQEIVIPVEVEREEVLYDRWNMDILDPRNVFLSPEYTYSLQDKRRVSIQYDTDIYEMMESEKLMGYINLDKVKEALKGSTGGKTDVASGSDTNDIPSEYEHTSRKTFKVVEVYLTDWVIQGKDEIDITPGYDEHGDPLKNAVFRKVVKSIAYINEKKILIRYHRNKFRDPFGNAYIPIVMGKCYIHPTNDLGFGDGKASYPLEMARNGMVNLAIDRVTLATLPVMKAGSNSAQEFRKTWRFEPRGIFEAYDANDIQEMKLSDDITGANNIMSILTSAQQAATASFPTAQGGLPLASTSATATAASESRTDARSFYKGLTYNHTALMELYDIIGWMTWQFALPETAEKLFGKDKIFNYNPFLEHTFKTVTESLETESSKQMKIQAYDNMFGQIAQIQNPNTLVALNYILEKKAKLLGDEYEDISDKLFNKDAEFVAAGAQGSLPNSGGGQGATNQTGQPINPVESQVRQAGRQN